MSEKAIYIRNYGDASCLTWEDYLLDAPKGHDVQIQQFSIGLNFIDIYQREGLYPLPLPFIGGNEGAGVVTACGEKVTRFKEGDTVAYGIAIGGYATSRHIHEDSLLHLPAHMPVEKAGALMLRGMTAEYLLCRTYEVQAGDTVLWHAAAGGLARIAIPWLKHLGAKVIGTVGREEKKATAYQFGCDEVLQSGSSFSEGVREICTDGVPVVYDSIGAATFDESLKCLQPRGLMVSFGNASGPITDFNILRLSQHGSLFLTRPSLNAYTASREDLENSANRFFSFVKENPEIMEIEQRFSLRDVQAAHEALEQRKTTGITVLLP